MFVIGIQLSKLVYEYKSTDFKLFCFASKYKEHIYYSVKLLVFVF